LALDVLQFLVETVELVDLLLHSCFLLFLFLLLLGLGLLGELVDCLFLEVTAELRILLLLNLLQIVKSVVIVLLVGHHWVDRNGVLVWVYGFLATLELDFLGCIFAHPSVLSFELDAGFPLGCHGVKLVEELLVVVLLIQVQPLQTFHVVPVKLVIIFHCACWVDSSFSHHLFLVLLGLLFSELIVLLLSGFGLFVHRLKLSIIFLL